MASAQQIAANQANARLSTGPADTSRTKFNGVQHGLTSKQVVIPGENQADYDAFHTGLMKDLRPGSETEKLLAERIVSAAWRLRRFTRMETAFFNNRIEAYLEQNPGSDPDAALANLFCDPAEARKMRLFLRYQSAVQREYDTAMRQLDKARKERAEQELLQAARVGTAEPADLAFEPRLQHPSQPHDGFASHDVLLPAAAVVNSARFHACE